MLASVLSQSRAWGGQEMLEGFECWHENTMWGDDLSALLPWVPSAEVGNASKIHKKIHSVMHNKRNAIETMLRE